MNAMVEEEQMAELIFDRINLLTDGDAYRKQLIVMNLVMLLYKEKQPIKNILEYMFYLNDSDFIVIGSLCETLIGMRMSDEVEYSYLQAEFRNNRGSERDDDLPF